MIYLVEDDESIRELVVYTLKSQDLDAKGFAKPSLFWKELEKEVPSLILLDICFRRGWDFYSEKAESKAGYQEASIIMRLQREASMIRLWGWTAEPMTIFQNLSG